MANVGNKISFDQGRAQNMKHYEDPEGALNVSGEDTVYYYIAAERFTLDLKLMTDFGYRSANIVQDYWDGNSWVETAIKGWGSVANMGGAVGSYISRVRIYGAEGWYFINGDGLYLHGYSAEVPNMYSDEFYETRQRGRRIGRIANGKQWVFLLNVDCDPYDSRVSSIYDTTSFRGSKITTSVPACCMVAL